MCSEETQNHTSIDWLRQLTHLDQLNLAGKIKFVGLRIKSQIYIEWHTTENCKSYRPTNYSMMN